MTIEEYLDKRIGEEMEIFLGTDISKTDWGYFKGVIDTLKEILEHLPKLEHDVTLKELHQYCDKHREENGHYGCPFLVEGNPDAEEREDRCPHCRFDNEYPCDWDIVSIQRRMKEAQQ